MRSEQTSSSLLRELVSRFTQPEDLVDDLFAKTLSATLEFFTVADHRVLVGCKADPECFRVTEETVLGRLAKAARNAERTSGEAGRRLRPPPGWLLWYLRWRLRTPCGLYWMNYRCTRAQVEVCSLFYGHFDRIRRMLLYTRGVQSTSGVISIAARCKR